MKKYFVYIMTNKKRGTLYIGVTNDLERRIYEHKNGEIEGFTKQYNLKKLVFFDETNSIEDAISYEKRLKPWLRKWKIDLIEKNNPHWKDLSVDSQVKPENDKEGGNKSTQETCYDNFATTFSASRKNLFWSEIEYCISKIDFSLASSLLDVGCGSGRLLESLKGKDIVYTGIDASRGMIEEAEKNHSKQKFIVGDMTHIETLVGGEFDTIFFVASFHHLENEEKRKEVLQGTYKLLKNGGKVYLINWALLYGKNKEKYKKSSIGDNDFSIKIGKFRRLYHGFTLKEIQQLCEDTGFTLEENRIFEGERNIVTILRK